MKGKKKQSREVKNGGEEEKHKIDARATSFYRTCVWVVQSPNRIRTLSFLTAIRALTVRRRA